MSTLTVIRHAQASFGSEDYDQLSPLGYQQADVLAQYLNTQPRPVNRVICGPCKRHIQTAEPYLNLLNTAVQDVEILDEFDEFDGLSSVVVDRVWLMSMFSTAEVNSARSMEPDRSLS